MSVDAPESHSLAGRLKSLVLAFLLLLELACGHNFVASTNISIAQGGVSVKESFAGIVLFVPKYLS
jgi:lipopolysaccharide export LptBFGC system permease protein LptF